VLVLANASLAIILSVLHAISCIFHLEMAAKDVSQIVSIVLLMILVSSAFMHITH